MRPQRCRAVSDRYNHHLVDRARNQNNTKHRRRALHSHRGRKNPAAVGRLAVPPGARAHIATTKQHPQTPKQAPHPLGARSTKGATIFPEIVRFIRLFIGGGLSVLLCDHFSSLSSDFRSFAFLAGFALFPKSRKVTKIDHTKKLQIF